VPNDFFELVFVTWIMGRTPNAIAGSTKLKLGSRANLRGKKKAIKGRKRGISTLRTNCETVLTLCGRVNCKKIMLEVNWLVIIEQYLGHGPKRRARNFSTISLQL
jgi:hypothetical protein